MATMDSKKHPDAAHTAILGELGLEVEKKLDDLKERVLPAEPHVLHVPREHPHLRNYPHETNREPYNWFEPGEESLQYMTMISNSLGARGIVTPRAMDEEVGMLAAQASGTATPSEAMKVKTPAIKISMEEYNKKRNGGPPPKPAAAALKSRADNDAGPQATPESGSAPAMARAYSSGGPGSSKPDLKAMKAMADGVPEQRASVKEKNRSAPRPNNPAEREKERERIRAFGQADQRNSLKPRDNNTRLATSPKPAAPRQSLEPAKNGLTPHLTSPRAPDRPPKRRVEGPSSQPEKRTRIEPAVKSSVAQKSKAGLNGLKGDTTSATKPPPSRLGKSSDIAVNDSKISSQLPAYAGKQAVAKPAKTKPAVPFPALLSPLRVDLQDQDSTAPHSKSSGNAATTTPFKNGKTTGHGNKARDKASDSSSPLSPSLEASEYRLPPLLSPGFPDVVEEALVEEREQQEKAAQREREKEAKRAPVVEKAPPADAVARKTGPKIGHPPKRPASSVAKSRDPPKEEVQSRVVTFKIKKNKRKDALRILRTKPVRSKVFEQGEAERIREEMKILINKAGPNAKKDDKYKQLELELEALETDLVAPKRTSTSRKEIAAKKTGSKKAPVIEDRSQESDASDSEEMQPSSKRHAEEHAKKTEPPAKRVKTAVIVEKPAIVVPALKSPIASAPPKKIAGPPKSPVVSTPSQKTLLTTPKAEAKSLAMQKSASFNGILATPKRSEAVKNFAMQRGESSNGLPTTPQNGLASAEKRLNGDRDLDKLLAKADLYFTIAIKLKRHMDAVLKTKERGEVSESAKLLGCSIGIESIAAFIISYFTRDQVNSERRGRDIAKNWAELNPMIKFLESFAMRNKLPTHHTLTVLLGLAVQEEAQSVLSDTRWIVFPRDSGADATNKINAMRADVADRMISSHKEKKRYWHSFTYSLSVEGGMGRNIMVDPDCCGIWMNLEKSVAYAMGALEAVVVSHKIGWVRDAAFGPVKGEDDMKALKKQKMRA